MPAAIALAVGWAALACAEGGLDAGNAVALAGPTGAALALVLLAPAAALAAWSLRRRAEPRSAPAVLALCAGGGAAVWSFASIGWAAAPDLAWLAANRAAIAFCALVVVLAVAVRIARPGLGLVLALSAAAVPPVVWGLAT